MPCLVDPEIDRVDRTSLKSSQSTFNTYEVNEIGSVITHITPLKQFLKRYEVNWETFCADGQYMHARCHLMFGNTSDPSTVSRPEPLSNIHSLTHCCA